MRVFHGPLNIAGIAGVLAQAERELGVEAFAYCLPVPQFAYPVDRLIEATTPLGRMWEMARFAIREAWRVDVFHFHFGCSLTMTSLSDVPWLKRLGKKICFYFHGCDIRDSKQVIARHAINACAEHWPMACSANRKKAVAMARRYADRVFVSTPDLHEFIPNSIWLPQPVELERFVPLREQALSRATEAVRRDQIVTIAHAPSDRMVKGTRHLEQAMRDLQAAGYAVELRLVENKSYLDALACYAAADIVVDQLLVGAYGRFAVEMMALGKPVICYIREDLRPLYPATLPIVSATPHTLGETLKQLMTERHQWPELGRRGVEYVTRVHDSRAVAMQTVNAYRATLHRN